MKTTVLLPKLPKIIKKGENQAVFEIENCFPGYGLTLGNALRRVLLSSLPGAAITSVRIKGVKHEFSTIPYILEDIIQIILNLKKIRFKLHSQEPTFLSLKVKGEKEVKASDIKLNSDVEIINKDAHIATLTDKKAELEADIEVDSGLGYVLAEQRTKSKLSIGSIAIDAIFSPVKRVNCEVENMRVGDKTDFNRLRVEIETDGSISPEQAFQKAAQILVDHISVFTISSSTEKPKKRKSVIRKIEKKTKTKKEKVEIKKSKAKKVKKKSKKKK